MKKIFFFAAIVCLFSCSREQEELQAGKEIPAKLFTLL
jgi:hypothetical protein